MVEWRIVLKVELWRLNPARNLILGMAAAESAGDYTAYPPVWMENTITQATQHTEHRGCNSLLSTTGIVLAYQVPLAQRDFSTKWL